MPCYTGANQSYEAEVAIKERLRRLESLLEAGTVSVVVGAGGSVAFKGWAAAERGPMADLCAYRRLASESSWALRQAVARAEAIAGVQVNKSAVASGLHSHDGGSTWSRH